MRCFDVYSAKNGERILKKRLYTDSKRRLYFLNFGKFIKFILKNDLKR